MNNKDISSFVDGKFNPVSHNKMLLADLLRECDVISKAYESVAAYSSMAIGDSSAEVCGRKILNAFYEFLPVVGEVRKQIENELD